MAKITKAMQNAISEYCTNLRAKLDLRPADYSLDPWKTIQICDGAKFFCNDKETQYALIGFHDEISPECAKKLGACHLKRVWNEYLAGVWFSCYADEREIWKHMNGEKADPPEIYANCYKLIPVKREIFRTMDINEDGMFEIELTPHTVGHFEPPEDELPRKEGKSATFPLRLRLSGGMPTGPIDFRIVEGKYSQGVEFECGGESYIFYTGVSYQIPYVEIEKWRARKDEEGAYLDVLLCMTFRKNNDYA